MEQLHRNFIRKRLLRVCLRGKPAHGLLLVLLRNIARPRKAALHIARNIVTAASADAVVRMVLQ